MTFNRCMRTPWVNCMPSPTLCSRLTRSNGLARALHRGRHAGRA
jgi:hypothetical protein